MHQQLYSMEKPRNTNQRGLNIAFSVLLFILTSISVYLLVVVHVGIYRTRYDEIKSRYADLSSPSNRAQRSSNVIEMVRELEEGIQLLTEHDEEIHHRGGDDSERVTTSTIQQSERHHWRTRYLDLASNFSHHLQTTHQPIGIQLQYSGNQQDVQNLTDSGQSSSLAQDGKMKWSLMENKSGTFDGVLLDAAYSSPIVPRNGTYLIYCQITWFSDSSSTLSVFKYYNVVAMTPKSDTTNSTEQILMTSATSQRKAQSGGFSTDNNPLDSSHISGVFRLTQGQIIAVSTKSRMEFMPSSEYTYLGLHQLV